MGEEIRKLSDGLNDLQQEIARLEKEEVALKEQIAAKKKMAKTIAKALGGGE